MATLPDAMRSGASDAQPAGSVLHMEMQAGDRRLLTLFASSFIAWIKDEAASSFVRDVGTPTSISLDETARDAQTAALHLTVTWAQSSTAERAARLVAVPLTPSHAPEALAARETPVSSLFTYHSATRVFEQSPDVTRMMAAVLEQSQRLGGRWTRARHVPDWIPASLLAGARRGRQVLARWMDAAIGATARILDRSRPGGRQVTALWYTARLASLAHAQSVGQRLRTRSAAGIKPMPWAAAGLFAASVIYVGWPFARAETGPVARGMAAAANPSPLQPATVMAPQAEKSPAALPADGRPTEAEPVPTSGVVLAAPASRAASPKPARATANATPIQPAPQPRGYVGSLVVTSEPQGADVSVDGVPQGRTPLAISNLNVGSRVVRLDLPGHQRWSWAVSVVANRQTPIAVRLLPVTPANVPPGVRSGDVSATRARMF
jgi:PEGA domain